MRLERLGHRLHDLAGSILAGSCQRRRGEALPAREILGIRGGCRPQRVDRFFIATESEQRLAAQPTLYRRYWDSTANVPWIYAPTVQGGLFITYEDRESIALKGDYISSQKFRGAMFWELSGDLTDGTGLLPLIKAKVTP